MRVVSGSHWAEVSEAPFGWRAKNRIMDATDKGFMDGFCLALVMDRTESWSLEADPKKAESWESIDAAFGDAVLAAAMKLWKAAPDPNGYSGESKPSPQDEPSETPSPS